ncbi:sensor histidine kinase [Phytohabitans flavus]|uniref:sensor histidine kinase n=1 Tax=Phytohabitans flavus TaxID=1076124 RepID=UPI003624EAC0
MSKDWRPRPPGHPPWEPGAGSRARWERRWERRWDPNRKRHAGGLAFVSAVAQVLAARTAHIDPDALGYAILLAGPIALAWRYKFPVAALAVTIASAVGFVAWVEQPRGPFYLAAIFAVFASIEVGKRAPTWALVAAGYVAYTVVTRPDWGRAAVIAASVFVALLLAEANRARRQQFAEVAKYRAEQARARAEQEKRQASEERLRIARELHDVLGHHLSLINVQAGVGLHLMDTRPEQAREALTAIKSASAEALREVRSVLGVLRPEEEAAPRAPAPSLARLGDLTADAGLPVRTVVEGEPRDLPAEVDRAAYRIVQEALTNVRRHAGAGAAAVVTIGYGDEAVTVRVADNGVGGPASPEAGNGIAGMRARAAALGGTLAAGPADGGGFTVAATLPLGNGDGRRGRDGRADKGRDGRADKGPDGRVDNGRDGRVDNGRDGRADKGPDGRADKGLDGRADKGSDGRADEGDG